MVTGKFNPIDTITHSLNDFKNSVQNVPGTVISHATSAITSFPMYKLAQADPKLYNILNNNVIGAHNQYALNMKSCEVMQTQALKGNDPYNSWLTVSRNNNMKHIMSFGDGDLNTGISTVNQEQGDKGVAWVTPGRALGVPAGGVGQPPIRVIYDTAVAGYNVMLGRHASDITTPEHDSPTQSLLNDWPTPLDAAEWIVTVVGDETVTTCTVANCPKASTAGRGLLSFVQSTTLAINKKLKNLVLNPSQIDAKHLLEISAPGQVVSPDLIHTISQMNANAKANTIATLAQNIATTRIINQALLAINILQIGSEIPNIHSVGPAQTLIRQKIKRLQQAINQIMYSVNIRRELNSNVMHTIMQYNQAQNSKAAMLPRIKEPSVVMNNGGIVKGQQPL